MSGAGVPSPSKGIQGIDTMRIGLARLALGAAGFAVIALPGLAFDGPPVAPVRPVTNTYWGQAVVDSYQWMEDEKDPQFQSWLKAEDDATRKALAEWSFLLWQFGDKAFQPK